MPLPNAAACAIKCDEPLFRAFLKVKLQEPGIRDELDGSEPWLPLRDKEQAAIAVRHILQIKSRRELNEGQPAARWQELKGDFYMWERGLYD